MSIIRKAILISALILGLLGVWAVRSNKVLAQSTAAGTLPTIVDKIAEKFGLKKEDVQSVFDNFRTDRQALQETRYEEWLNSQVKDRKITENQKTLILNKSKELKSKREANFQQKQSERQALLDWAKQNNIDPQYLFGGYGFKMGKMGHGRGFRMK